ncbi:hypothetical protein [Sphingorhabdus sp. 109]|uniref:hypothetical protein n=1 Tax=Sphingorhabdus sp. 109 TaxID=2653173 RepID=UPI0012F1FC6D|nr:hypothetical protein [Sphingorhabdus sp. 109]VWX56725.1 conserved hypothetical protein [Sphingorhabdus sp. 109]
MAGESDILVRLRLKGEEFSAGVKDAFSGVGDEAEKAGSDAGDRMAKGFTAKHAAFAAAGAAAFGLLVKAVNDSVDLGANIAASAQQIGIGTDALQEYQYVAEQVGVSQSELEGTLQELTLTIGEAASGNRKFTEGFAELGIALTDTEGRGRTTDQVFQDIIKTLGAIEDPSERARIGTQLLGEEYQQLEPILALGADGVSELTDRLYSLNGVLSEEEIQKLQETNAKFDELQRILSINIASTVAENAESIISLSNSLADLVKWLLTAHDAYKRFWIAAGQKVDGMQGWTVLGKEAPGEAAALARLHYKQRQDYLDGPVAGSASGIFGGTTPGSVRYGSDTPRTVTPPGGSSRGRGSRKSGASAEQREQERAAKALAKEYERLEGSLDRQVELLQDASEIDEIRRTKGELAAEIAKKHLDIERQFPTLVGKSADAVAERYNITVAEGQQLLDNLALTKQMAEQASLEKWYDLQDSNFNEAIADAEKQIIESQKRVAEQQRRIQEEQLRDISDFYYDLFSGNTGNIWKDFKRQGLGVISDIAAQWTLALLAGKDTSLATIAGNVMGGPFPGGGSPLGSLLGALSPGGSSGQAANDNYPVSGEALRWYEQSILPGDQPNSAPSNVPEPINAGFSSILGGAGIGFGVSSLSEVLGLDGSSTGGAIGGAGGSALATALFGAGAGPIGAAVGGLLGSIVGGMLKSTKRGSAIIGGVGDGLGITGYYGNSSSRKDAAGGLAGSALDSISSIAEALGGNVNSANGLVSIGIRDGNYRVDPQGRGYTKTSKYHDVMDFGEDQEAAVRAAIADLIGDGVIEGISDASQKILRSGQEIETAIEKAVMIEQLPDLLQQRLDPLGYELDQIYDKYKQLADVLREGGANAEQFAQAQQLWELEKADAIAAIGGASDGLKEFLLSLNAGSGSPLSLRQQQVEAEAALAPYIAQIREAEAAKAELDRLRAAGGSASDIEAAETAARIAAQKIDQSGFQDSGSLLLNISRQIDASGAGFFTQFDRIRDLTNSAISLIDNAVPIRDAAQDPFTEATANILSDHTDLLHSINDNLVKYLSGSTNGSFDSRNYAVSR